jgi:hypothetical protein
VRRAVKFLVMGRIFTSDPRHIQQQLEVLVGENREFSARVERN